MSDVTSWFDDIQLRRNPHRAPMIQDALDNGCPVTEEMLWGRCLSADEIEEKTRALLATMVGEYGFTPERAKETLARFESRTI